MTGSGTSLGPVDNCRYSGHSSPWRQHTVEITFRVSISVVIIGLPSVTLGHIGSHYNKTPWQHCDMWDWSWIFCVTLSTCRPAGPTVHNTRRNIVMGLQMYDQVMWPLVTSIELSLSDCYLCPFHQSFVLHFTLYAYQWGFLSHDLKFHFFFLLFLMF